MFTGILQCSGASTPVVSAIFDGNGELAGAVADTHTIVRIWCKLCFSICLVYFVVLWMLYSRFSMLYYFSKKGLFVVELLFIHGAGNFWLFYDQEFGRFPQRN